jgi:hypothetical protein
MPQRRRGAAMATSAAVTRGQCATSHLWPSCGCSWMRADPLVLPHYTTTADELFRHRSPPPPEHQSPVPPVSRASRPWVTSRGAERFLGGAWTHRSSSHPSPSSASLLQLPLAIFPRRPLLSASGERRGRPTPPLCFLVWVTSGPNGTAGPARRLNGD